MNGFVLHVERHEIKVALNGICIEKAVSDNREGETIMSAPVALIYLVKHGLMVLSKECIPLKKSSAWAASISQLLCLQVKNIFSA